MKIRNTDSSEIARQIREFEEREQKRLQQEIKKNEIKHKKRLEHLKMENEAGLKELEQLQVIFFTLLVFKTFPFLIPSRLERKAKNVIGTRNFEIKTIRRRIFIGNESVACSIETEETSKFLKKLSRFFSVFILASFR